MAVATSKQLEQRVSLAEAWIDGVKAMLDAQAELFVSGLRSWQRLTIGFFETYTSVAAATSDATLRSTAKVASRAGDAASDAVESMPQSLASEARGAHRRAQGAQQGAGLDALTVEQLDRLANTSNVEGYPQGGTKAEKVTALVAAGLSLEALSVEHLDRLAAATNVDDYPRSGTKREKIAALEAAEVRVTSAN